jgi:hypothetical protein
MEVFLPSLQNHIIHGRKVEDQILYQLRTFSCLAELDSNSSSCKGLSNFNPHHTENRIGLIFLHHMYVFIFMQADNTPGVQDTMESCRRT